MIEQHNTLTEKFLKKWFWLYFFSFVIAPTGYIIKIIVSGEVSVSELWVLYWILSLVSLLAGFNDFWMTESLNYFIPKYIEKDKYDKVKSLIAYSFLTQLVTGIIIAFILFFGAEFLASSYFKSDVASDIVKIFALYFLWVNIFQVFNNFFLAVQNTFYNKLTEFLRMLFILGFTVFVFLLDLWNIVVYSSARVLWMYFWLIFVIYFFYRSYYKKYLCKSKIIWSRSLFKKVFSYALLVFVWSQAWNILSQIDMQMVIYLLGTKDAWYYTNYLSIVWIPVMIIWPIFWLLFPMFSEMNAKKENNKIKMVKEIMSKNFIAVAISFNILMFVFAETIAYTLFWEKFLTSWVILKYSVLFLVFNFLLHINFSILAWIWRVADRVKIIFIALIFNFIMNLIFIKLIWVYWAALATWIWWILIYAMSEYFLWRKYFIKFDFVFLVKNVVLLWILGILGNVFVSPLLDGLWRLSSLWAMFLIWIFWFLIFIAINFGEFKNFVREIMKLRSKI